MFLRKKTRGVIAVLSINGRISDATASAVFTACQRVEWEKAGIAGLLIRICSEGGSLAAAQAIVECIETLRSEAGLKVVCVVEDMAMSAAFHLALCGDHVFATPAATVGAVGAITGTYRLDTFEQRLGISYDVTRSAPHKGDLSLHGQPTASGKAALQSLVDDVHGQFVEWIQQRRKLTKLAPEATDGRMFSGRQAVAWGLIDSIGATPAALACLGRATGIAAPRLIYIDAIPPRAGVVRTLIRQLPFGGVLAWLFNLRD